MLPPPAQLRSSITSSLGGIHVAVWRDWFEQIDNGDIIRRRPHRGLPAGSVAGSRHANGEVMIRFKGAMVYAHRLAFLLRWGWTAKGWRDRGKHACYVIRRRNGDIADNRIDNLECASKSSSLVKSLKWRNAIGGNIARAQAVDKETLVQAQRTGWKRKRWQRLRSEFARARETGARLEIDKTAARWKRNWRERSRRSSGMEEST